MLTLSILLMLGGAVWAVMNLLAGANHPTGGNAEITGGLRFGACVFVLGLVLFLIWCMWPAPSRADDCRLQMAASLENRKGVWI